MIIIIDFLEEFYPQLFVSFFLVLVFASTKTAKRNNSTGR